MAERAPRVPLPTSRFVGRRTELGRLQGLFAAGQRLVTIWGAGGMGKTRLALQYAASFARKARGRRRAYCCDLSLGRDLPDTCAGVARALDVPLGQTQLSSEQLVDRVGDLLRARGTCLVVLDNFEHVATLAPETLGRWLAAAPEAQFLVTSRERLRIEGEVTEELGPLALPVNDEDDGDASSPLSFVSIARSDAVELFLDRAQALAQDFRLREANAPMVAALCEQLEGIPLAIELAAGRLDTLGVEGLLAALGGVSGLTPAPRHDVEPVSSRRGRLDVLGGGRRDMAARQVTLRAAIAWSWDLLSPVERQTLSQCSVFRGGFTAAAAVAVLDLGEDGGEATTLEQVQSLRNKSLLRSYEASPGELRLALFESVREFADEQLELSGKQKATAERHSAYYFDLAARSPESSSETRHLLSLELGNLQSIVERGLAVVPPTVASTELALRALVVVDATHAVRSPVTTHLAWLDRALTAVEQVGDIDAQLWARALQARGRAQPRRGRVADGLRDLSKALELVRRTETREVEGAILADLGVLHHGNRNIEEARRLYEEALEIQRDVGDRRSEGRTLGNLGALLHDIKSFDDALRYYTRALTILREVDDRRLEGIFLTNLGILEHELGLRGDAHAHLERALSILSGVGDRRLEAITLGNLGMLHHEEGRLEAARSMHRRALTRIREAGDRRSEGLCLSRLAAVLAAEGQVDEARTLFDAAEDVLGRAGDPVALEVIATSRAFLDIARAVLARASGAPDEAEQHVEQARVRIRRALAEGSDETPAPADMSDDIRASIRMLKRALERIDGGEVEAVAPPPDALLLGPDASWLRPPESAWQDLRRRKNLRLILLRLVEEREQAPGKGLSIDALRDAGWPGETITIEAATNRVHVSLVELRKRGLKPLLLKVDGGYLLDPSVKVRRVSSALCPA